MKTPTKFEKQALSARKRDLLEVRRKTIEEVYNSISKDGFAAESIGEILFRIGKLKDQKPGFDLE